MEQDEFIELKEEVQEVFEDDVLLTILYRQLDMEQSTTEEFYGVVNEAVYDETSLLCSVVFIQNDKQKRALGVSDDCRVLVTIPTLDLENKGVTIDREKGWFVYDGIEYEIVKIDPKPRMYSSSIVTRVELGKEKPLRS